MATKTKHTIIISGSVKEYDHSIPCPDLEVTVEVMDNGTLRLSLFDGDKFQNQDDYGPLFFEMSVDDSYALLEILRMEQPKVTYVDEE